MQIKHPCQLLIVGKRHSGKTSTIEFLIRELSEYGLKVGALKHSSHQHDFDKKGSDSDRYRNSGAVPSAFSTPDGCAVFLNGNQKSEQTKVLNLVFEECDIVLIESFQNVKGPKVWIRSDQEMDNIPNETIAIIDPQIDHVNIPVFNFDDKTLVGFIIKYFRLN